MLDFYACDFVALMRALEAMSLKTKLNSCSKAELDDVAAGLEILREHCVHLELFHSTDQIDRIDRSIPVKQVELSGMLTQLSERISDELVRRAFYAIKGDRMEFYELVVSADARGSQGPRLRLKDVTAIFGSAVVDRLGPAVDDLEEARLCFVLRRNKACVFHLMSAVEVGVVKIAKLIGIQDSKPSWGAILTQVERLVLKTKRQDRTSFVNQHFSFFERVLPEMQAIQRAWRNRVSHVEDRILPQGDYSDEVAENIMNAVRVFIAELARDLPMRPS